MTRYLRNELKLTYHYISSYYHIILVSIKIFDVCKETKTERFYELDGFISGIIFIVGK